QSGKAQRLPFYSDLISKLVCFVDGQLYSWGSGRLPPGAFVSPPTQDGQGNVWFVSDEGLIKTTNGRMVKAYTSGNGLPERRAKHVYGQRPLKAFILGDDGSLWLTDLDSMQSHLVARRPPEGLKIHVSYADREGNYWFGTLNSGLYRARKQSVTAYSKTQGLIA